MLTPHNRVKSCGLTGDTFRTLLIAAYIVASSAGIPTATRADELSATSEKTDADQPNMVFSLTDDHRWDSCGASEKPEIHAPNLDRIADPGTRFANAFLTLAICSPSRAACLTGRQPEPTALAAGPTTPHPSSRNPETPGATSDSLFAELYDLSSDPGELKNLADQPQHTNTMDGLRRELSRQLVMINTSTSPTNAKSKQPQRSKPAARGVGSRMIPTDQPKAARTGIHISGVYPHLTTYGVYSQNGAHYLPGHNECGIGAVVPWAGKLWMVNYAPHKPHGSDHKLFSVDPDLSQLMTVHPESVGGTPAGRMIHAESNQLLIAHHLIDQNGNVRTIQPKEMPIRVTAIARHLSDPANLVYYIDMEGSIWEANVHTLAVKRLFKKPVPGWHSKGGYTSQGRLVVSNNGELHVGDYKDVLVGGKAKTPEERGVLAEFDGTNWKIVERRQFTEVTGPQGITGGSDGNDPIWTMGWDRRSVRLKVLDNGDWHTYLLPKAAYCNDASHGWYTEWPRIREITDG